jgi:hypothetical protein
MMNAMKAILLVFTIIVLAVCILGCNGSTSTKETIQAGPKYTADQVIAIAQAQYPVCYKNGVFSNGTEETPTIISVKYIGDSKWQINIKCPDYRYSLIRRNTGVTEIKLYFYEADGSLSPPYKP